MDIKNCYKLMIETNLQFKEFHEENKNLSTDELKQKYNIEIKEQD